MENPTDALRLLDRIRLVSIADAGLLVALVIAAVTDSEGVVGVLGPIHGVGYLLLLFLCGRGAGERYWGWWFPALVIVTLGPPGSIYGDLRLRPRLRAAASPSPPTL